MKRNLMTNLSESCAHVMCVRFGSLRFPVMTAHAHLIFLIQKYCGNTGDHFGDECPFRRSTLQTEPSAFSDRSLPKRDRHLSRHPQSRGPGRDSPRHKDHDRQYDGGRQDSYRPPDPPPSRKKAPRPGRRDRAAYARPVDVDDEDDWFSKRHRRQSPKKSEAHPRPSGSKSSRVGGSYKGGYIK
jgi:hypothetical protein